MVPAMVCRAGTPVHILLLTDGPFFLLNAVSVGLYFGLSQKELTDNTGWKSRLKYIPGLMGLGIGFGCVVVAMFILREKHARDQARFHRAEFVERITEFVARVGS